TNMAVKGLQNKARAFRLASDADQRDLDLNHAATSDASQRRTAAASASRQGAAVAPLPTLIALPPDFSAVTKAVSSVTSSPITSGFLSRNAGAERKCCRACPLLMPAGCSSYTALPARTSNSPALAAANASAQDLAICCNSGAAR